MALNTTPDNAIKLNRIWCLEFLVELVLMASGFVKMIPEKHQKKHLYSMEMGKVFPDFLTNILRQGFLDFGKSMKGYLTNEAILHAPESRTSSPVRIPRDAMTLEHLQIKGLYPCGEGAGYAGGIISAAIDRKSVV